MTFWHPKNVGNSTLYRRKMGSNLAQKSVFCAERNWTIRSVSFGTIGALLCKICPHLSSIWCGIADIFWMSKCHSVLGPVKPVFLPHVMVEALVEYEQATWLKMIVNQRYRTPITGWETQWLTLFPAPRDNFILPCSFPAPARMIHSNAQEQSLASCSQQVNRQGWDGGL